MLFPSDDLCGKEGGNQFVLEKRPVYPVFFSLWYLFSSTYCLPCDQFVVIPGLGLRRRKGLIESFLPEFPASGFHMQ